MNKNKDNHWIVELQTPVVLGGSGLSANRHEGDNKSPMGVFALTTAFGFDKDPLNSKLRYQHILADTYCIDDPHSRYYNQIVDAHQVRKDWRSSEKMRTISLYRYGLVVPFNPTKKVGRGSCIFMHVWANQNKSTAGCMAMPLVALKQLIEKLDPHKHPLLIQSTRTYLNLEKAVDPRY